MRISQRLIALLLLLAACALVSMALIARTQTQAINQVAAVAPLHWPYNA